MHIIKENMQAAILKSRNKLIVEEIPTPKPISMEVLIKVEACACCSTDIALIDNPLPGQPPYGQFVPGHEYSGTIVDLGVDVDEFKIGDRVAVEVHLGCLRCRNCRRGNYTACLNYGTLKHRANGLTVNGGFAQYAINNINTVYPIPAHIGFDEASLLTNLGCVLYGFETIGGYIAGHNVTIIGPGPLGLISTQVAKTLGAEKVFLIGTSNFRLNKGRETGADRIINVNNEDAVSIILHETNELGVDLIIDASGGQDAIMMATKIIKPMGKILVLGIPKNPVPVDLKEILLKNISVHAVRGEGWANVARAISLVDSGKINLKSYVTHILSLKNIMAAFDLLTNCTEETIKIIIKPWEDMPITKYPSKSA